jgi:putative ABC transport system substrate-binding protein
MSIRRRRFITLVGAVAAAWPFTARAEPPAMMRVGVAAIRPRMAPLWAGWDQRLQELGYVEGKNLVVDFLNPEHTGCGSGQQAT